MINKSFSAKNQFNYSEFKDEIITFIHSYIDITTKNIKEINDLILYNAEVPVIKSNLFNNNDSQISPFKENLSCNITSFPEFQNLNTLSFNSNNFDLFESSKFNPLENLHLHLSPKGNSENILITKELHKEYDFDDSAYFHNKVNLLNKELDAVIDFKYEFTIDQITIKKKKERPIKRHKYNMYNSCFKQKVISYSAIYGVNKTSKDFSIPKKSLKRWILIGARRKRGGGRKLIDPEMENKLYSWYHELNKLGFKPSSLEIKKKALELCPIKSFIASNGWLIKFKSKYNLILEKVISKKN